MRGEPPSESRTHDIVIVPLPDDSLTGARVIEGTDANVKVFLIENGLKPASVRTLILY